MKSMKNKMMGFMGDNPKKMEFIRFIITGIVSTITNYLFYYLFFSLFSHTLAFTLGYIIAVVVNYIMTTYFTFKVKASAKNGFGFIVSNIINYTLCIVFLNFFIWLGISELWAPIPMYCITIPTNFIIVRFVMNRY